MIGCRPLDDAEIPQLLAALASNRFAARDQTLAMLGITSGFRISELLSLRIRDVTTAGQINKHVRIPASRMKGKKRARSAILAPPVRPYLRAWLKQLHRGRRDRAAAPLFRSRTNGGPLSRVQAHRLLHAAYARAALVGAPGELATHTLRKTYAAKMWHAHGESIWKLQNALGHASPASTVAYLSFEESEQATAVEVAFSALHPWPPPRPATQKHTPGHIIPVK